MEISNPNRKLNIVEKMITAMDDLFPVSSEENLEVCNRYIFHCVFILNYATEQKVMPEKFLTLQYKTNKHIDENEQIAKMLKLGRLEGNSKKTLID